MIDVFVESYNGAEIYHSASDGFFAQGRGTPEHFYPTVEACRNGIDYYPEWLEEAA